MKTSRWSLPPLSMRWGATGSYIIVQDTIIDQKEEWINLYAQCPDYESEAGSGKAVTEFLRNHHTEMEADASRERYLLTFCPGRFLKRE